MAPPEKLLTEEVPPPRTDTINALVAKLRPKLIRVLTTPEAIAEFMATLAVSLGDSKSLSGRSAKISSKLFSLATTICVSYLERRRGPCYALSRSRGHAPGGCDFIHSARRGGICLPRLANCLGIK